MAKKFAQVYKVAKETAYGSDAMAFVLAASLNSAVDFTPILASNGIVDAGATTAEYIVQRVKRIKAHTVAKPNTGATSDALAALDQFSKVDWETVGFATGILKGVGIKTSINEEFDIDALGEGHAKAVADSVSVQAVERKEAILDEVVDKAQDAGKLAFTEGKAEIFKALSSKVTEITLLSDDFKHMTDKSNIVIHMHPTVADLVVQEIGQAFYNEAPIYTTGLSSKFSINGVPVLVDSTLNKYDGAANTETIGAIVMDIESIAFKAANETKPVSIDLGLTKYNGTYFYNVQAVVDASRIAKFEFTRAATSAAVKTKKVSE